MIRDLLMLIARRFVSLFLVLLPMSYALKFAGWDEPTRIAMQILVGVCFFAWWLAADLRRAG